MVKTITYKYLNGIIKFEIKSPYWCRMILSTDDKKDIFIGGDSFDIIRERLLKALLISTNEKSKTKVENRDVIWALSLMETYTTIFVSIDFPKTIYFLYKDKELDDFDKLELSNDEYNNLIKGLSND